MTYTIYFTFEKGKRRNHTNYASFCLITDGDGKHVVENIIYENRKLKSHRGL